MASLPKISIIGAGFVGSTAAHWIASRNLGDIVLLDRDQEVAKGKALDLLQSLPIVGSTVQVLGTSSYEDIKDAEVVVITAGVARKPGMSRDDLFTINKQIVQEVSENVRLNAPEAILIVVTNPLDAMVYVAWKKTGFHPRKVTGMAGILDTARMRTFIAQATGFCSADVSALVLGGHGDSMVPLMRLAQINGVPISTFLSTKKIQEIVERTHNGGAEIVQYLKTGSAYFAPGAAVMEMVAAIVNDEKRVLPCAAYLQGEYGVRGLFVGVPVILGSNGVEKVVEIPLDTDEKKAFKKTVGEIKNLIGKI